ncbi:N-acetyltransferase [Streptomyces sp. NPDC020875]|uniref:N-acetyltransferase n=1 Tax=Streptomyces sp. NPDC020875 TaxID=3154898 RepID=UPI0033E71995
MTFEVRRLGPGDLPLLLDLQRRVHGALADPSILQTSTPEFIAYCLGGGGRCYGVRHGARTVAYRIVYFPRDRPFNLARDTAIDPAEHRYVAHWDTVAVLPERRGHGLAGLMNTRALADLADTDIRHLLATSAPANPHGVRTLMAAGFRPVDLVRKFGGRLRFLLYRPAPGAAPATGPLGPAAGPTGAAPAADGPGPAAPERVVDFAATAELARAFADGWTGAAMEPGRDGASPRLRMVHRPHPFGTVRN